MIPPLGDAKYEKQLHLAAYRLLPEAGYKAVGHDLFSRVQWHFRENCLNGLSWGGVLTAGSGCFMGYLQRCSYSNLEDIKEYMAAVNVGRLPISRLSESTTGDMIRMTMTRL